MKKLLTIICTLIYLSAHSQSIVGDRVIAKKETYTNKVNSTPLSEPSYEIEIFPDIQNMVKNTAYQPAGRSMFDWVAANRNTQNIKAVLQLGDITNNCTPTEWDTAHAWFSKLDTVGMPYAAPPGNHDYHDGFSPATRDDTAYNRHFGVSRFAGKSFYQYSLKTPGTTYGNNNNDNYWIKFSAGSRNYAVLALEFMPRDTVVNWANNLCDSLWNADPTRQIILVTHAYITVFGERATDTSFYTGTYYGMTQDNSGQELWDKLIRKKHNIRFVVGGHYLIPNVTAGYGLAAHLTSDNDFGNPVEQIFVNFQDDNNFGNGFMLRLKFTPLTGDINASFWSPYENAYDTLVQGYSLKDPIHITSTFGVAGSLSVNGDFRSQGRAKFESLTKGGIPFTIADHSLVDTPNLRYTYDSSLLIKGVSSRTANNTVPVITMWKGDSAAYTAPYIDFRHKDSTRNFQIRAYQINKTFAGSLYIGDSSGINSTPGPASTNAVQNLGIGYQAFQSLTTGNNSTALGAYAFKAFTTGGESVAVGFNAGMSSTTGCCNTAVGAEALRQNTTGGDNTAIGQGSMVNVVGATASTAIGSNSLQNMVGTENVAMGKGALGNGLTGNYNTALGRSAGRDATGNNGIYIGYYAGYGNTTSNRLFIDGNGTDAVAPLIYGEFDNQNLVVTGSLAVNLTQTVANAAAALDITTTTKGVLMPRLTTTQQNAITSPLAGLIIYNTDTLDLTQYNGTAWRRVGAGAGGGAQTWQQTLTVTNGSKMTQDNTIDNQRHQFINGNASYFETNSGTSGNVSYVLGDSTQTAIQTNKTGFRYVMGTQKNLNAVGGTNNTAYNTSTSKGMAILNYPDSTEIGGTTGNDAVLDFTKSTVKFTRDSTIFKNATNVLFDGTSIFSNPLANLGLGTTSLNSLLTTKGVNGIVIANTGTTAPALHLRYGSTGVMIYSNTGGELIGQNTGSAAQMFRFSSSNASIPGIYVGNSSSAPSAVLHIKAGTAAASTAPLKFTSGVNLTTPEDGAVEYNGTHFYATVGSTRYQLDQQTSSSPNNVTTLYYTSAPDANNSGTNTQNIITLTVPAATLGTNGDKCTVNGTAVFNTASGTKQIQVQASDGTNNSQISRTSTTADNLEVFFTVVRKDATHAIVNGYWRNAGTISDILNPSTVTWDFTQAMTLKMQIVQGIANDITAKYMTATVFKQ